MVKAMFKAFMFLGLVAMFVVLFHGVGESTEEHSQANAAAFNKRLAESRDRQLETGIDDSYARQDQEGSDWGN